MQNSSSWLALALAFCVLVALGFSGGYATAARFSDTETKHVTITADISSPPEVENQPAISFVAFCVVDGTDAKASAVSITNVQRDGEGKPVAITYESSVELSTIVVFGSQEWENFDGGTSGTLVFGTGTTPESAGKPNSGAEQTQPAPCPSGETEVVKFEYNETSGEFAAEAEAGTSSATAETAGIFGVQSVENTPSETEKTNDSNVTPTATPTETPPTSNGTATGTPETETPTPTQTPTATPTPTSTPAPTPTETEATTETPEATSHILENSSSDDEPSGDEKGQ